MRLVAEGEHDVFGQNTVSPRGTSALPLRTMVTTLQFGGMVTVHLIGNDGAVRGSVSDHWIIEVYAHSILTDPSNRYAIVPHVAPTDGIRQFRFDVGNGRLRLDEVRRFATTPGHGHRHLAFHPGGWVLNANEDQSSSLDAYRLEPSTGGMTPLQSLSTLPRRGFQGKSSSGSVRVHAVGKAE